MDKEDVKKVAELIFERILEGRSLRRDQLEFLLNKEVIQELRGIIMWYVEIHKS